MRTARCSSGCRRRGKPAAAASVRWTTCACDDGLRLLAAGASARRSEKLEHLTHLQRQALECLAWAAERQREAEAQLRQLDAQLR